MKKNTLLTLSLGLLLALQLNFCSAEEYQEELTLPVGAHFDLEMDDEITGMDYDAKIINIEKINGRDVPVLKQTGDTVVTVYFKQDNGSVPMKFLLHSLTTARYDEVTDDHGEVKPEYQQQYDKKAYAERRQKEAAAKKTGAADKVTVTKGTDKSTAMKTTEKAPAAKPAVTTTPTAKSAPAASKPTAVSSQPKSTAVAPAAQTTPAAVKTPVASVYPEQGTFSQQVLFLTNEERAKNKLASLTLSEDLQRFSNIRAEEITTYFSHARPNGSNYTSILPNDKVPSGENLGCNKSDAKTMFASWLNNPTYKANILNPQFKEMAVGHAFKENTAHKHYWVQLFRG